MLPVLRSLAAACAALLLAAPPAHGQSRPAEREPATAILDTAIARMGGAGRLRALHRVRFEMVTQWQRTTFDERPYTDVPSYELHSDLRDYELGAWRNTRRFPNGAGWTEMTDVVHGDVAIRRSPGGNGGVAAPGVAAPGSWVPLNVAYADERRELFALAPERVLLALRDAPDLRPLPDTQIAGAAHARRAATVDGVQATLLVRRTDGFPAVAWLMAAHPNDFGLAPWGRMRVEMHYSGWRAQNGLVYPFQWDVRRVGRPYKRITVLAACWDVEAAPDSFAISDSLRAAYQAASTRAMHDLPLDSARLVGGRFAVFATPGAPFGAVRMGREWILLEGGQAPLNAGRAVEWLARAAPGTRVAGAVLTRPSTGSGGIAWLAREKVPVYASPGVLPFARAMLAGHDVRDAAPVAVAAGRWVRVGGDSVWLEPMDLPDAPGAMLVYVPELEWLYSATLSSPLHRSLALARVCPRGWRVSRVGTPAPAFDAPKRASACPAAP